MRSSSCCEQFLPADVAEILHIFQIDLAELVQGCRKGFLRCIHMCHSLALNDTGTENMSAFCIFPSTERSNESISRPPASNSRNLALSFSVQFPEHAVETVILR